MNREMEGIETELKEYNEKQMNKEHKNQLLTREQKDVKVQLCKI